MATVEHTPEQEQERLAARVRALQAVQLSVRTHQPQVLPWTDATAMSLAAHATTVVHGLWHVTYAAREWVVILDRAGDL